MALSLTEENRLQTLENKVENVQALIENSASTQMLVRLQTLSSKSQRQINEQINTLEEKLDELILLAQKLQ